MPDSRMVRSTVGCPFDDLVMPGFAVAYAFGVQEQRRRTSRGRGRRPRPLCHGVSTANGSGTSIRRHTACSWAPSDPWCGTLNTDACPDGRSRLARTRFQPCLARSEPSSTEKFPASTQSATAASLGVNVGTLRLDCPAPGIRDPVVFRNRSNASSSGESDQTSHVFRARMRRLAMACVGRDAVCRSRENTLWIS